MTNRIAVIAGGGIAGTVTALALQRAGWQPRVYEAYDQREGAWLTVAVNGLAALRELGEDPAEILAAGFPTPRLTMSNAKGRRLAVVPLGGPMPDGTVTTTIKRTDLYAALRRAAGRRGIPIEHGKRLTGFTEEPDGVTVTFADGTNVRGDLLVGADGLRSRTRQLLNPEGPRPRYLGLLNAGGFTDRPVEAPLDRTPGMMHMAFGRRAFFGWGVAPDGRVWWFANPARKRPVEPGEFSPEQWRAYLIELFEGDDLPAAAIIRATDVALGPWNTDDLPRVPAWHSERVVLVGDAAHAVSPSSGQGASMAIEDAVALGRSASLAEYERRRRARVERVVAYGKRSGSSKTAGPIGSMIRDAMFPLVMKMLYRKGDPQAWIFERREP
ncbi:FAD-dependent monooxygenase [Actinoplanes sp. NPDC048796]|uniref:FAD-dependent oxidoreductase n=1 Tax=unclassified Actinoplanes TaxID=2626549 RepID=UPI0033D83923